MKNQNGNVLLYVLIAVALLAALTYTISRDNRGGQAERMEGERAELLTTDLMSHVNSIEQSVFQMMQWGKTIDDLKFDKPADAGYTSNTTDQVYHPAGGGVQPFTKTNDGLFDGVGTTGFVFQSETNVEWSPTAAKDLILSFVNVNPAICALINEKITGSSTIPTGSMTAANVFVEGAGTDANFVISECAACENNKSLCINDGSTNIYYTILVAQ